MTRSSWSRAQPAPAGGAAAGAGTLRELGAAMGRRPFRVALAISVVAHLALFGLRIPGVALVLRPPIRIHFMREDPAPPAAQEVPAPSRGQVAQSRPNAAASRKPAVSAAIPAAAQSVPADAPPSAPAPLQAAAPVAPASPPMPEVSMASQEMSAPPAALPAAAPAEAPATPPATQVAEIVAVLPSASAGTGAAAAAEGVSAAAEPAGAVAPVAATATEPGGASRRAEPGGVAGTAVVAVPASGAAAAGPGAGVAGGSASPAGSTASPGAARPAAVQGDAGPSPQEIAALRRRIDSRKVYPQIAIRNGWEGRVLVEMHLEIDGRLAGVRLVAGSGYSVLDEATITAVRLASPFPPIARVVTVPVEYRLIP